MLEKFNSSCPEYHLSYVAENTSVALNYSNFQGATHSSCPNKFSWLAMIALVMYIVSFAPGENKMEI